VIQFSHGFGRARHGWQFPCNGNRRAEDGVEGSGADRSEADRAHALLLTLDGWASARIAQAFGVREDTVRLRRSDFARGGVDALRASVAPGPVPVKAEAALRVAAPLLSAPVEDRRNWTLSRLADEIARREGFSISRSQLSKVLREKGGSASGGHGTR
jgi:transposase